MSDQVFHEIVTFLIVYIQFLSKFLFFVFHTEPFTSGISLVEIPLSTFKHREIPTSSNPSQPTWIESLFCGFVHSMPLQDDICPPLVCTDVRLSHDLGHSQVVFNGSGGCGTGNSGQNLLVLSVSKIQLWTWNTFDAEREKSSARFWSLQPQKKKK